MVYAIWAFLSIWLGFQAVYQWQEHWAKTIKLVCTGTIHVFMSIYVGGEFRAVQTWLSKSNNNELMS